MKTNVILIGFMGAGKTSVGQALEKLMKAPLLDTDQMIEEQAGMTISEIFAVHGEETFRRTEAEVLAALGTGGAGKIISTGGGLPLREENRRALRAMGTVFYLRVQPETVLWRLRGDTTRPLLQGDHVEEKVRDLLAFRDPLYREGAHVIVDVDRLTPEEIAGKIRQKIVENSNIIV